MLFHEIYGCYYHAVAKMLSAAVKGRLTQAEMKRIADETAFSDSFLEILPALREERWQLLTPGCRTPLRFEPKLPLTTLQKRWLKAVSLDPRIQLFSPDLSFLRNVPPLFTPSDFYIFDQYNDGDPYTDSVYIAIFRTLLEAIHTRKKALMLYSTPRGVLREVICDPYELEYSEKDDKFRVYVTSCRYGSVFNVGRISSCKLLGPAYPVKHLPDSKSTESFCVLELVDARNTLERVMLHFAHYKKEAERLAGNRYRLKIYYDQDDETELVIRVLSFGPMVRVTEPNAFIKLIRNRLQVQKVRGIR